MFGKTHKSVLTLDANDKPTAVASSVEQGMFEGAVSHVMSLLSKDTVVTGAGRTIGEAATFYGAMQLGRRAVGGQFAWNPFAG